MDFDDFPAQIIIKIFSYLTKEELYVAAKVSKRMRRLAFDPTLWTEIHLNGQKSVVMSKILRRSLRARKIYFNMESDFSWMRSLPKCDTVEELNFLFCSLHEGFVSLLVNLYPRVTEICIVDCHVNRCNIDDIVRWEFLKSIYLCDCDIRRYNVHHRDEVNDYFQINHHYDIDDDECVKLIAEKCRNLEELDLLATFSHITDSAVLTLTKLRGAQLRTLTLQCENLTSVSYQALRRCPRLKRLHLHENGKMTVLDLRVIDSLKFLEDVYLEYDGRRR